TWELLLTNKADIVFLVDGSSSIGIPNFQQVRVFLRSVVSGLDIGPDKVRVGLAQFSNEPHKEFLLKDNLDASSLLTAIDTFPYRTGGTKTGKAIDFLISEYFTEEAGSRANQRVPQIAVVITDGDSEDEVEEPAQRLRQKGVIVFAIGVGKANQRELEDIVGMKKINMYNLEGRTYLGFLLLSALAEKFADIFFLLDGGMTASQFQQIKSFLIRLSRQLNFGASAYRLAQVYLNSFRTKDELLNFIKILPYRGGGTNTGAALNFTRENIFVTEKGSRKDKGVEQVAVVITDGDSQDAVSEEATELRRAGVTVYSVGVENANYEELMMMASYPPQKHVFIVDSFTKLKSLEQSLQKTLCYNIIRQAVSVGTRSSSIKEGVQNHFIKSAIFTSLPALIN
uniref:VWFA domain-containing protein n=1 Tax=Cyprinodon variegatus TaxID=28743 RepID=A0A3Q2FRH3_CYPVA